MEMKDKLNYILRWRKDMFGDDILCEYKLDHDGCVVLVETYSVAEAQEAGLI